MNRYDIRSARGLPCRRNGEEATAEFDRASTIDAIEGAIRPPVMRRYVSAI